MSSMDSNMVKLSVLLFSLAMMLLGASYGPHTDAVDRSIVVFVSDKDAFMTPFYPSALNTKGSWCNNHAFTPPAKLWTF